MFDGGGEVGDGGEGGGRSEVADEVSQPRVNAQWSCKQERRFG